MANPDFRLDGKVALITGGAEGIGAGIAEAYAAAGAEVILVGRRVEVLNLQIARIGSAARAMPCDVTDVHATSALIAALPRLDILVNNAGTNIPERLAEVTEDHFDRIMDLNVRACFFTSQAAVAKMRENGQGGAIIHISSQMGHVGSPNRIVYCASKHAVEGMTKAMAIELAPERIRVNAIAPTFVDTPLIRKIVDTPQKRDFLVSKIPMGDMAQISDITGAALFLASASAGFITGHSLKVDGGWTAQ